MGKSLHPRRNDLFNGPESDWFSSDWFSPDRWHFPDEAFSHRSPGVIAADPVHEIEVPRMPGTGANLTLTGAGDGDTLIGTSDEDTLIGFGGDDTLKGKGGDDVLDGRADDDKLIGGKGNDWLAGGSGDDTLTGNKGDDTLIGGTGDDLYRGQSGRDVFVMDKNGGDDSIRGFSLSDDRIDVSALGITDFSQLEDHITSVSATKLAIDLTGFGGGSVTLTNFTGSPGAQNFIFAKAPPPGDPPPAGEKGDFDITVVYSGAWTESLKSAFSDAVDHFESIIWGDLSDTTALIGGSWTIVDDVAISAALVDIDGEGGILGQAGPTGFRFPDFLPTRGLMRFDVADANWLDGQGSWDEVVKHEMAHVLGFGSLWPLKGLLDGAFTSDPRYVGAEGMREYGELLGTGVPTPVPVEQDGGLGTALAHWDEETFDNELMTGFLNAGSNPFSDMSAAAFADLGYDLAPETNWLTDEYALIG